MTYGSNEDLFWVSAGFTDSLMHTNFVPYMKYPIPDQNAFIGEPFTYAIPDSTFFDDDSNTIFTYSAMLTNGNPLPGWLTFDTLSGVFTGMPELEQTLNIKAIALDDAGATASTTCRIITELLNYIYEKENTLSIYPNPTNGIIYINPEILPDNEIAAEIINLAGQVIFTDQFRQEISIDLTDHPTGIYFLKLTDGIDIRVIKFFKNI